MNHNLYKSFLLSGWSAAKTLLFILLTMGYTIPVFSQSAPNAPTNVTASPLAVCQGNSTTLKATSPGNTIKWYVELSGGASIGASNSGANFSVVPQQATTYYAESYNAASGLSSVSRTAISVTVNTRPEIISTSPDIIETNEPGQCGRVVNYPPTTVTGVPSPTVLYSQGSGSNFQVGTTTVLTTAVNACGNSSLSFDVTVNDVDVPLVIAPPNVNLVLPEGETSASSLDLGQPEVNDNCGEVNISNDAPSVFYGGTTTITWTVSDNHGHSATATQTVVVTVVITNTPPSVSAVTTNDADNTIQQNTAATLNVSWNDEANGGPYRVEIDWRDSSAHTVLSGVMAHNVSATHTYNKTGVFSPIITVTDGGNMQATMQFKYVVVYVVGNYSTTAEGEFYAPAGSLVAQPNLTYSKRKVEFGVQCKPKYCRPGVFDGDLEFDMDGAHFEFETEDVDWDYLAVSACFLAQFQGSGYLYQQGHNHGCHGRCHSRCSNSPGIRYGVLIVQSDKYRNPSLGNRIRVKIWNQATGAIIFDTQMGDPDDALPTTPFSKGSVKVKVPNNCVARTDELFGFSPTVSPNPFTDRFTLNVETISTEEVIEAAVYDVMGKQVQVIYDVMPNEPITVQANLPVGMYFVHIKQGFNTKVIKMIRE